MGKRIVLLVFSFWLGGIAIQPAVWGKRVSPSKVSPVVFRSIKFVAPNDPQKLGVVEGWDVFTQKKVWETKVYDVTIDPSMEVDVQWVFVSKLEIKNNQLVVTNEKGQQFTVPIPHNILKPPP